MTGPLDDQGLEWLVDRLVTRLERGGDLTGTVRLDAPTPGQREAIESRLARPPGGGSSLSVDLVALERVVVGSGAARSLADAVVALRGPVASRAETEAARAARWDGAWAALDPALQWRPGLEPWAARLRASGVVVRVARTPEAATELLGRCARVLTALPAEGESLSALAARNLGSAHALDRDAPVASLVLGALRFLHADAAGAHSAGSAAERRALWAEEGVALDALSSTVLVHRVPLPGPLGELTAGGEPVVLTLRQMRGLEIGVPPAPVHVCENPVVVEAAADAGARSPLVCVQGHPSAAATRLLSSLAPAGLRYHGDLDWGGIRIANGILARFGAEPWRLGAADLDGTPAGAALSGRPADASWDAQLRPALLARGTRLEEEQVLDRLLDDLE